MSEENQFYQPDYEESISGETIQGRNTIIGQGNYNERIEGNYIQGNIKDVFICHAREDNSRIVEPLVNALEQANISYWYDEAEIRWGDSIVQKVNEGLNISRFIIVVISKAFLNKRFPQRELFSVLNKEIYSQEITVLPLLAISNREEEKNILQDFPLLTDKAYLTWDGNTDRIIEALLVRLPKEQEYRKICSNQRHLNEFLQFATKNLERKFGFIDIKNDLVDDHQNFKLVARKQNFDISVGFIQMRGEAFFIFSEFAEINFTSLKTFSTQCLKYAKAKTDSSTAGSAFYNFKIPNNLCFAITLVDNLDEETKKKVRQINPLRNKVDALWYEIPVIYELNNKQLYFYEKPLDWIDKFTGEIAWKEIREIIKQALTLTT